MIKRFIHLGFILIFKVWFITAASAQCLTWFQQSSPILVDDLSPNAAILWNDPLFQDALNGFDDLAEGETPAVWLKNTCVAPVQYTFILRLDLDGNGSRETVITDSNQPAPGNLWFNNANAPGFIGTTTASFDTRNVPANQKYSWAVRTTLQSDTTLVSLSWKTAAQPNIFIPAQLPYGNHQLTLKASNGQETIEKNINIQVTDGKRPAITCKQITIPVLSSINISEVKEYAEDNYSPVDKLVFSMRVVGNGSNFPTDSAGNLITRLTFTCNDVGDQFVEVWAKDQYGNTDFCIAPVTVGNKNDICPLQVKLTYQPSNNCADENALWSTVRLGQPPYSYLWSNGSTDSYLNYPANGVYQLTVTDAKRATAMASYTVSGVPTNCVWLNGYVMNDRNKNCQRDAGDQPLGRHIVTISDASGNKWYAATDNTGYYTKRLPPGQYTVTTTVNSLLWAPCQPSFSVTLVAGATGVLNFPLKALYDCPALTVTLTSPYLLACTNNIYRVEYCNVGTEPATDAYVEIELDDYLTLKTAERPFTALGNGRYRFPVGNVPVGICDGFTLTALLSCSSLPQQTHCATATAHPRGTCLPTDARWSGASLQLDARCDADSLRFVIKNVGTASMHKALEYIVIEDLVIRAKSEVGPLVAGGSMLIAVPYNGATWRVEAAQEKYHPDYSSPALSVEACRGVVFKTGIEPQFYIDDQAPWKDVQCTVNQSGILLNGKDAWPKGYGKEHFITPETPITYSIRFVNTTADTMRTVVVRDTLSKWLDPATLQNIASGVSGRAGFKFHFNGTGPILQFTFDKMTLPPFNPDDPFRSTGWVSFTVLPKPGTPLGTDILNTAAIAFGQRPGTITNTVQHRLGKDFIARNIFTSQTTPATATLEVMPNPVQDWIFIRSSLTSLSASAVYVLFDVYGKAQLTAPAQNTQRLNCQHLPSGTYFLQLRTPEGLMAIQRIIKQ